MSSFSPYKKVFVVIVTYNGLEWIENCLSSVLNSDYPAQIVVVDNCSSDSTVDVIRKSFPMVNVVVNKVNAGFGAANNIGMSTALDSGAEFLFLLNQDTTVGPDTISKLVEAFESSDSNVGILSPIHLSSSGAQLDQGFLNFISKEIKEDQLTGLRELKEVRIIPVNFVNAAAWMISLHCVNEVGGFAPLFFHYGEDRDLVNRVRYFSMKVGVVSSAFIRHYRDSRNMEVAGWPFKKKVKYYFVGWLTRAADINKGLIPAWFEGALWVSKEVIVDLIHLRVTSILVFAKVIFQIVAEGPKLIAHREDVKKEVPFKFIQ